MTLCYGRDRDRDRPSYRDYDGSDRQGDYRMFGELSRSGDYQGGYEADIIDSRSYRDRYDRDYRRSFRAEVNRKYKLLVELIFARFIFRTLVHMTMRSS